jgi:hypothetical protein
MLTRRICLLTTAFFSISSTAAAAASPLQPIRPWNLDYGETQCIAAREYGSPADPVSFAIRSAPNGETYELLMARNRPGPETAVEMEGTVDFGQGPINAWLLSYRAKKSDLAVHQYRITAAEMAQARSARSVTLSARGGADGTFALANMNELLAGLEECTADLKRHWNADGQKSGALATGAQGDVRNIFRLEDYPLEASSRDQQGSGRFLLLIDERGGVAGCQVLEASVPALDAMGCQVIRERAKFTPAVDRSGKPVRSIYVTPRITWQLGD